MKGDGTIVRTSHNTEKLRAYIQASIGIPSRGPIVREVEDLASTVIMTTISSSHKRNAKFQTIFLILNIHTQLFSLQSFQILTQGALLYLVSNMAGGYVDAKYQLHSFCVKDKKPHICG
jgi:hypothetical protein